MALLIAPTIGAVHQVREMADWTRDSQSFPMGRFKSCAKVYFDNASAEAFALQRGDMTAWEHYSPQLARLLPTGPIRSSTLYRVTASLVVSA